MDIRKKQSTLTSFMGAKPKVEPVGGWSREPALSGVEVGKSVPDTGIKQSDKVSIVGKHLTGRYQAREADFADVAMEQSLIEARKINVKDADTAKKHTGYNNEAFETLRLKASGRQNTVDSQVEISFNDESRGKVIRRPDLLQYDYGLSEFRFGDIKTKEVEDPQQILDMASPTPIQFRDSSHGKTTGIDVTFSNSSTQLSSDTLQTFEDYNQKHGAGRIRVRSNSMSEGTFITPSEMQLRQNQRKQITKP